MSAMDEIKAALVVIREQNKDHQETWMHGSSAELSHRKAGEALAALPVLEAAIREDERERVLAEVETFGSVGSFIASDMRKRK